MLLGPHSSFPNMTWPRCRCAARSNHQACPQNGTHSEQRVNIVDLATVHSIQGHIISNLLHLYYSSTLHMLIFWPPSLGQSVTFSDN